MNILIPDEWLREFLKTKASPEEIARYLSLCGPSVERIQKIKNQDVYLIEVTTNRVDSTSVYGIAREANAILPRFGIKSSLERFRQILKQKFTSKVNYLQVKVDPKLCPRFTAVLIKNVTIDNSPEWMQRRLELVGLRPINNVVDISNYIMYEIGQPLHTFDYNKIAGSEMILRESQRGEEITTLDGQKLTLPGGDIVIEDGKERLIDLAGIMGGLNSAVDEKTKNVLVFVQTYNPVTIRRTSMSLSKRTHASDLFEKGLDTELVEKGIARAISLFQILTKGIPEKEILDIYPNRYKENYVVTSLSFIEDRLGVKIPKSEISKILNLLQFKTSWDKENLKVTIPSFRANDVKIPEDIVEEVARIYGYHNLPSILMEGKIPDTQPNVTFDLEMKIKQTLKGLGATEVYTLSLVSKKDITNHALKLKNPLGKDTEYLRTSLMPSLVRVAERNSGESEPFHLFEIANIYIPKKTDLPEEKMILAGIFSNTSFRDAKGIVETLLEELNINAKFQAEDSIHFQPSRRIKIISQNTYLGQFGILEKGNLIYYEFEIDALNSFYRQYRTYKPIPKYPTHVEDISLILPTKTRIGDVLSTIQQSSPIIDKVELWDMYKDSFTIRIWYQHPEKTLSNKEVEEIRNNFLKKIKEKFGVMIKD